MASFTHLLLLCSFFSFLSQPNNAESFRPRGLIVGVTKDPSTLQYITQLRQRTPLVTLPLTVDLGQHLWVSCQDDYVSSSYSAPHCGSDQCNLVKFKACVPCTIDTTPGHGILHNNNTCCALLSDNSVTHEGEDGDLSSDILSLQSTNGRRFVSMQKFLFTCSSSSNLLGLSKGVKGMAGLGRTKIAIPSQLSKAFSLPNKFALCLPSSSKHPGVIVFGGGPYYFESSEENLIYTPLFNNPVSTASTYFDGEPSSEYFIGVKSIKVSNEEVHLNATKLIINEKGYGGTKLSALTPYTVMETSIYKAVTKAFRKVLGPKVAPMAPFKECFNSKSFGFTSVGPAVPTIELVLQGKSGAVWSIIGANSMVKVKDEVWCLGLIDGGVNPRTSIVIGGYQMENILFEFDNQKSRLGFSTSLQFSSKTCSDFTSTPSE